MRPIEEMEKELNEIGFSLFSFGNGLTYSTGFEEGYITRVFFSLDFPRVRLYFHSIKDEFNKGDVSYYELCGFFGLNEIHTLEEANKAIEKLKNFKERLEKIKADLQPILDKYNIKELYNETSKNN